MEYPPRPWTNGQKFIYNGVTYVYDLASNSWNFDSLIYNRVCRPIQLETPTDSATLELEFSLTPEFSKIVKSYYSVSETTRKRLYTFDSKTGRFLAIPDSGQLSQAISKWLFLLPEVDLANRYFVRYRWVYTDHEGPYDALIY